MMPARSSGSSGQFLDASTQTEEETREVLAQRMLEKLTPEETEAIHTMLQDYSQQAIALPPTLQPPPQQLAGDSPALQATEAAHATQQNPPAPEKIWERTPQQMQELLLQLEASAARQALSPEGQTYVLQRIAAWPPLEQTRETLESTLERVKTSPLFSHQKFSSEIRRMESIDNLTERAAGHLEELKYAIDKNQFSQYLEFSAPAVRSHISQLKEKQDDLCSCLHFKAGALKAQEAHKLDTLKEEISFKTKKTENLESNIERNRTKLELSEELFPEYMTELKKELTSQEFQRKRNRIDLGRLQSTFERLQAPWPELPPAPRTSIEPQPGSSTRAKRARLEDAHQR